MSRRREETLDQQGERELEALERGLAGEPVPAELDDWAQLARLLAAERPEPRAEWAAALDERVARRFRRGDRERAPGAAAEARGGGDRQATGTGTGGATGGGVRSPRGLPRGPGSIAARIADALAGRSLALLGGAAALLVVVVVAASTLPGGAGGPGNGMPETATDAGAGAAGAQVMERETAPAAEGAGVRVGEPAPGVPPVGPAKGRRLVQRDAQLSLSTDPDRVRDVADEVISATRSLGGIVASSQVSERGQQASASLALSIPAESLDAALDRLTSLAHVESMSEGALDITRSVNSARDRLRDARAERARLLEALRSVSGAEEAAELRKQIAAARRRIGRARSRLANETRRARYAQLSVTVRGVEGSGAGRSLSEWLERALDVLRAVAGVMLISAAILIPLALLGALVWLLAAALLRRRRERALDDQPS